MEYLSKEQYAIRSARLKSMGLETYKDYLRMLHWQGLTYKRMKKLGWSCQRCGKRAALSTHHIRYNNLGHERFKDLYTVCKKCHKIMHEHHTDPFLLFAEDKSQPIWASTLLPQETKRRRNKKKIKRYQSLINNRHVPVIPIIEVSRSILR